MTYGLGIQRGRHCECYGLLTAFDIHCWRGIKCEVRRDGWRMGHWQHFSAYGKADYARELRRMGWSYEGQGRWICPRCNGNQKKGQR